MLDNDILVDAGTGAGDLTLGELLRVRAVFLTHSHLDHVALLPMVADAIGPRRDTPLVAYALPETIDILRQNVFNFRLWPDYTAYPSREKPYLQFRPIAMGQPMEIPERGTITPLPVRHAVPAVAYQFDSGSASFVFSGDTTYHDPFWQCLNEIQNLRYLMLEATFLNDKVAAAEVAGHMRPELIAKGLRQLNKPVRFLVTHMEPGNEDVTMEEIRVAAGQFRPERAMRGQVFEF